MIKNILTLNNAEKELMNLYLNNTLKSPQLIQSKSDFIFYLLLTSFRSLILVLINRLDVVGKKNGSDVGWDY